MPQKTVALCLGSGGARGYTHIGVIDALLAREYEIVAISGCSIGALVGGFYSAGKLEAYRNWVLGLSYFDVLRMLDISFLTSGIIRGDRLFNHLDEILGDTQIEDLNIPFTAVATDLTRYKEVWFQQGSLARAIRASSAIPGMFTPVEYKGSLLVDGAVLNPLPITPCVSAPAAMIFAVDLSADVPLPEMVKPEAVIEDSNAVKKATKDNNDWLGKFADKASNWLESINLTRHRNAEEEANERENLGKLGIINRVVDVMSSSLTQYKIAGYPPDLLIKIPRNCCETYDFHRAQEMIELGRFIADQALDAYEADSSCIYGQRLN